MRVNRKFIREKNNIKVIVFIILSIVFLTIGVGYSYLKEELNIFATATIATNVDDYKKGNSKYFWEVADYVGENEGRIYNIKLNIINYDEDLKNAVISFDVPNSFKIDKSKIKNENASISYDGKRVNIMLNDFVMKDETLTLNLALMFIDTQEIYINNLTLNGLLAINE